MDNFDPQRQLITLDIGKMDLKYIFIMMTICFLANLEAGLSFCLRRNKTTHFTLRSFYLKERSCSGGNLLKINVSTQCKVSKGLCRAKCDGQSYTDFYSKFTIKNIFEKKCIQFTEQDGTEYALKVINGTSVAFEKRQCDSTTSDEFLFDEGKSGIKYYIYKHTVNSNTMCLGVTGNCNDKTLSLISTNGYDRRCYFKKRRHC